MGTAASTGQTHGIAFRGAVAAALEQVACAIQSVQLYGLEHTATQQAARAGAAKLREANPGSSPLVICIEPGALRFAGETIGGASSQTIIGPLVAASIAKIEFHAGTTVEDILGLARVLAEAPGKKMDGAAFASVLQRAAGTKIVAIPVDYRALELQDLRRSETGSVAEQRDDRGWKELMSALSDRAGMVDLDGLSECISQLRDESDEHLRGELDSLHQAVDGLARGPEAVMPSSAKVMERMNGFLAAMNPRLRDQLVQLARNSVLRSRSSALEQLDELPVQDVLDALEVIDSNKGEISADALRLIRQVAPEQETSTGGSSAAAMTYDAPPPAVQPSGGKPHTTLSELWQSRQAAQFNSVDYDYHLEALLGRQSLLQPTDVKISLPPAAKNNDHLASIATLLAAGEQTSSDGRIAAIMHLARELDALLARNQYELVLRSAQLVTTGGSGRGLATETASSSFIDALQRPSVIDRMVGEVGRQSAYAPQALALLNLGGPVAAKALVPLLGETVVNSVRGVLRNLVQRHGAPLIGALLDGSQKATEKVLFELLDIAEERTLDSSVAEAAKPLLLHTSAAVRRRAFSMMMASGVSKRLELIRTALLDDDIELQVDAVEKLSREKSADAGTLIWSLLTGRLRGSALAPSVAERAVEMLLDRDDEGVAALCEALRCLSWKPRFRTAQVAKQIAVGLRRRRENPLARRALRLWNLSPSRVASALVRSNRPTRSRRS